MFYKQTNKQTNTYSWVLILVFHGIGHNTSDIFGKSYIEIILKVMKNWAFGFVVRMICAKGREGSLGPLTNTLPSALLQCLLNAQ